MPRYPYDPDHDDDHGRSAKTRRRVGHKLHDQPDDTPDDGDRWTTWDGIVAGLRGPQPVPDWLVTAGAAVDHEPGILKTGKEADVFLLERGIPGSDRSCLLAAKRYRDARHRAFQRDAGYLEGRRVRRSREMRAMATRTDFGRDLIAQQWAAAEFAVLTRLWEAGAPVPYPVSLAGTELLLEFVGDPDGTGAPRLAQLRPEPDLLASLWEQVVEATIALARLGYAHADLSPYNLLVHDGRLVLIDLPQAVDVVANPRGAEFLARDVANVARWFTARGLDVDADDLTATLLAEAGVGRG
ncbi:MAG TPA: RIO1 family regulatory kinase/ATPase [Mycobacteriales bacterium]